MAKNRKTPDMNLPVWFDGQNINEALFCEEFLHERRIIFANGAFFTPDGRVTDDLPLRGEIYDKLKFCAVNNIPRKITNILEVLKLEAQVPDFPPEQDRIHLSNGTLLLDGTFTEGRPAIVRSRLPVAYNPNAPAPEIWQNFLDGLLHAEDIPTLQEFIGYCLIPSNKGQRMMVIKGNGGEGKSQIGAVLSSIFGTNMKDGSIGKISENRFARADLEHILLCVDDDMRMEALRQTNYVKSIVTAQGKMDLERKGKQILPSAEGVTAIANIPDYLKSASMTAEWENELLRMERGETKPADFMQGIGGLLERMLADLRQIPTVQESPIYNKVSIGNCPVCGKPVCEGKLNFYCSDRDCKFALWKESKYLSGMKKTLTKKMATDLLKKGRTYAKDFYSAKKDKTFAADLVMAIENGRAQYSLEFPKTPAKK